MSARGKENHAERQWAAGMANLNAPTIRPGKLTQSDFDPAPGWLIPALVFVAIGVAVVLWFGILLALG